VNGEEALGRKFLRFPGQGGQGEASACGEEEVASVHGVRFKG
jgi:hypothetical protein